MENSVSYLSGCHICRKEEKVSQEQLSQEVMPDSEPNNEHI
jgi:hypothetical protein